MLQTDTRVGLTENEVIARRKKYGLNQMKEEKESESASSPTPLQHMQLRQRLVSIETRHLLQSLIAMQYYAVVREAIPTQLTLASSQLTMVR